MSLNDLLMGLQPEAHQYSMTQDPIYGPLFQGMANSVGANAGAGVSNNPRGGVNPDQPVRALARDMAAKYGWDQGAQWRAINKIISAESGWNPRAVNPSSGAAGLPQMLPSAHPDVNVRQFLSNPQQQLQWFLRYIQGRYNSPVQALQTRNQQGWY